MGYKEDHAAGNSTRLPRMFGFQASGAAPIVNGKVVDEPSTIATAIRIGNPASWTKALDARNDSGGLIAAVTDREILSAYRLLAREIRRLFAAELVVFGADWFVMVPLLVLLPRLTGSGVWGALVLAADTGINALLLPYAGTVADRVDRRKILITANLAAVAAVLLLFAVRSAATAPLAVVAVGAMAVAKAFYSPAATAALPNVVDADDLAAANAISGSAWGTMTVLGASLGGVVSSAFGPDASFVVTLGCLLLAVLLTALVRRPLQAPRELDDVPPHAWHSLLEAARYI